MAYFTFTEKDGNWEAAAPDMRLVGIGATREEAVALLKEAFAAALDGLIEIGAIFSEDATPSPEERDAIDQLRIDAHKERLIREAIVTRGEG